MRPSQTTDERERIKALEREVRELRQANEILRNGIAHRSGAIPERFKMTIGARLHAALCRALASAWIPHSTCKTTIWATSLGCQ